MKDRMHYPKKDTKIFKVLEFLSINEGMTLNELYENRVKMRVEGDKRLLSKTMSRMVDAKYVKLSNGRYAINPELKAYVEDVTEVAVAHARKDVVPSPYFNPWTPEMSGYTKTLYANKRGY